MKVFIAGASGRVGTKLTHNLIQDGHEVVAGARNIEKVVKNGHVTPVKFDLHESVAEMAQAVGKVDAIYFTAGSGAKDLLQTDAFGAVKLMQAAAQNGITRFIMLSALFSLEPNKWRTVKGLDGLTDYNIAKFFADNYLTYTALDYTILQPTVMTDKSGTGKITVDDVAKTLSEILKYQNTKRKIIKMREGSTPIDEALSQI
ncbi:NAD(P)H-binding protein [uncultured Limosilactobacillus sp.]|uniref:NAD(P)H-binding protein n=1 Tax=uncultured Limosilactobacillus sp. TaxID=2837629 RepID=UPI00265E6EC9|nr:NAD(P)H-binding protein [uncultured Limosilactobacillus sp.]